jgi:type II secretory pathway pseudopilin PulG
MRIKHNNGRNAFTLVEMLVATALVMFIMLILSEAFVAGLEAFRTLKAIGDMEERLRAATTAIREDLRADHFDGKHRLSDPMFWNTGFREGFVNVTQGFFVTAGITDVPAPAGGGPPGVLPVTTESMGAYSWAIVPGQFLWVGYGVNAEQVQVLSVAPNTFTANFMLPHTAPFPIHPVSQIQLEGLDADGIPSRRAFDHVLHLAVNKRGNRQQDFFTAHIPALSPFFGLLPNGNPNPNFAPTTFFDQAIDGRYQDLAPPSSGPGGYKTQWVEVAYFLWPNGTNAAGTPLYALYRAEFKVVPDNRYINGQVYTLPAQPGMPSVPMPFPLSAASLLDPRGPWVADGYNEMSARGAGGIYYFHTPTDLASRNFGNAGLPNRAFTFFYDPTQWRGDPVTPDFSTNPDQWSASLVATDVVSFDIQVFSPQIARATGIQDFTDLPGGLFDTAYGSPGYTVNAIKITLRVWDLKTRQTRQVSIIQDM